jgi:hypothetical protein
MSAAPLDLSLTSFADIEAQIANVLDPVTKVVEAIDHNPLVAFIVPAQYRTMLDDLTKVLEAADAFLHKTP